jgi:hypothetical protein
VVLWELLSGDAGDHITGVSNDDLKFVSGMVDHEKASKTHQLYDFGPFRLDPQKDVLFRGTRLFRLRQRHFRSC